MAEMRDDGQHFSPLSASSSELARRFRVAN